MKRAKSKPASAPARVDSKRDLADLQRSVWQLVSTPLTAKNRMKPRVHDGRKTTKVVGEIIKPNDRLTSLERLEIYNRMYWFRVLDSLYEDCPGLRAVLGDRKFIKMAEAYMVKYPSRSHTLRNLPDRLARFILEEPKWTRPHTALCHDLMRFEWAQVEVYDGATLPLFTPDQLVGANVAKLRLALQPYLQLLEVGYPVDDFLIHIKKREALLRGDTSNAPTGVRSERQKKVKLPKPERCHVAVHRHEGKIYFKRLDPAAGKILLAIRAGKPLGAALAAGLPSGKRATSEDLAQQVQTWFRTWMQLGWFCRRE
ncbi:HvfC/BufC family peptide modification chaperone [Oleiharenicola lentus]|uniref:HvfC/BufC family peptide modification chaperone n=1 Tax=Oleiharenicola lentus TaxID=2508720 RepID=UPI003F677726